MPEPTPPEGLFITGTGYSQGSTMITAALARCCSDRGLKTAVLTPAEVNCAETGSVAPLLKWAARSAQTDESISPYRMDADLDPSPAATHAGLKVDFNRLVQNIKRTISENDFTLVDASGGLMVPLVGGMLMADLAAMVGLPVIVVNSPDKSSVNHTYMSLLTARLMNLNIAGYMINKMPENKSLAQEKLPHTLAVMTIDELLGVLPLVDGEDQDRVIQLSDQLRDMKTASLLQPYLP